jgi:hypothetical protein
LTSTKREIITRLAELEELICEAEFRGFSIVESKGFDRLMQCIDDLGDAIDEFVD